MSEPADTPQAGLYYWCGHFCVEGKKDFYIGTVRADTEMEALPMLHALLEECGLKPVAAYAYTKVVRGALYMRPDAMPPKGSTS